MITRPIWKCPCIKLFARSLTEIYIIIFLQKLKIFENTPKNMKNLNKMSMAKAMGPFRDSGAPSWLSVTQTDSLNNPPYRILIYFLKKKISNAVSLLQVLTKYKCILYRPQSTTPPTDLDFFLNVCDLEWICCFGQVLLKGV
jgi:hypothetical protein